MDGLLTMPKETHFGADALQKVFENKFCQTMRKMSEKHTIERDLEPSVRVCIASRIHKECEIQGIRAGRLGTGP
jgi:hypothetical protein